MSSSVDGSKEAPRQAEQSTMDGSLDVSQLAHLEVKNVARNLEARYNKMDRKYSYTSVSNCLIAMNPYERLPIYGQDVINEFHQAQKKGQVPSGRPHPYGVAARAYLRMIQRKCNQSVIVHGESGAGKVCDSTALCSCVR